MGKLIGREKEVEILQDLLKSDKSELIAIFGRRRVGKTFLIRETYKNETIFDVTGIYQGSYNQQLTNFHNQINNRSKDFKKKETPKDWLEAFTLLGEFIDTINSSEKKVIFIDEFPWMYTHRSNFVSLFAHFWNNYCTKRDDLVVVLCGSAASFMLNKVVNDKGGLHNRVSQAIRLMPFNLYEAELYLKSRKVNLGRYNYLQLYMAMGGIPHYLEKIKPGDSVAIAIDRLFFADGASLKNEFDKVFASLFEGSENHEKIVEALASTKTGLTRDQVIKKSGVSSGGTFTKTLTELMEAGFISDYKPLQNLKKETLYRLSDEYSYFYLKYINNNTDGDWVSVFNSRSYSSWSGFVFETICMKHTAQIKKGLGIHGVSARSYSWRNENAQIDLLIDRNDNCINLCEMKFTNSEYTISKRYNEELQNKKKEFINELDKRKNVFITMVTTYGVKTNKNSWIVDNEVKIDSLFEKI